MPAIGTLPRKYALSRAQNSGSSSVQAQATLYYTTSFGVGTYLLPVVAVTSNKSVVLGVQRSVQSGIRDRQGDLIPSGTNFGMLTLAAVNGNSPAMNYSAVAAACSVVEGCGVVPPVSAVVSADAELQLAVPVVCVVPPDPPTLTSVSPTGAPFSTDTPVTIKGTNLDDPDLTVFITGGIKGGNPAEHLRGFFYGWLRRARTGGYANLLS
jgi:IPT/TIG domain